MPAFSPLTGKGGFLSLFPGEELDRQWGGDRGCRLASSLVALGRVSREHGGQVWGQQSQAGGPDAAQEFSKA